MSAVPKQAALREDASATNYKARDKFDIVGHILMAPQQPRLLAARYFNHTHISVYLVATFAVACVLYDSTQVRLHSALGARAPPRPARVVVCFGQAGVLCRASCSGMRSTRSGFTFTVRARRSFCRSGWKRCTLPRTVRQRRCTRPACTWAVAGLPGTVWRACSAFLHRRSRCQPRAACAQAPRASSRTCTCGRSSAGAWARRPSAPRARARVLVT